MSILGYFFLYVILLVGRFNFGVEHLQSVLPFIGSVGIGGIIFVIRNRFSQTLVCILPKFSNLFTAPCLLRNFFFGSLLELSAFFFKSRFSVLIQFFQPFVMAPSNGRLIAEQFL